MAKKATKPTISVDFSETESNIRLPEGRYTAKVDSVEVRTSKTSGNEYLYFNFAVTTGQYKKHRIGHICSLVPAALFRLRGLLEALGVDVTDSVMKLDLDELVGLSCIITVATEVYEGRARSTIIDYLSLDDEDEDEDDDEDDEDEDEDEDDEDDEDEDEDEDDEDEDEDDDEDEDEDEDDEDEDDEPAPPKRGRGRPRRK